MRSSAGRLLKESERAVRLSHLSPQLPVPEEYYSLTFPPLGFGDQLKPVSPSIDMKEVRRTPPPQLGSPGDHVLGVLELLVYLKKKGLFYASVGSYLLTILPPYSSEFSLLIWNPGG